LKEIVLISGKGGTGKTTLAAALAGLCDRPVIVDCDVDAANLHLLLAPSVRETHEFQGGAKATIDAELCTNCGVCETDCRFDAVQVSGGDSDPAYWIDPIACEGCGVCARSCPEEAIRLEERLSGKWFRSDTRLGPLIHAKLFPAQENSGKLVSLIRREARKLAEEIAADTILVDGPPGVGCPVIASLTGADYTAIVTEPTVSGVEDMKRAAQLAGHFGIPVGIVINKADLNLSVAGGIKDYAAESGFDLLGEICYDASVTRAQLMGQTVLEFSSGAVADAVRSIWNSVGQALKRVRPAFAIIS
jgi:MinD superfamily P-loop ATPase